MNAEEAKRELARRELARRNFCDFMQFLHPELSFDKFHTAYYTILDKFAHREIRKLIVSCPCQVGKSTASTKTLPAYLHGLYPDKNICISSYGFPLAEGFNRAVKENLSDPKYNILFPDTILPKTEQAKKYKGTYDPAVCVSNARNYRLIGHSGELIAVGRGGALTGRTVDIGIVDDLYKDEAEANSPIIRDLAWSWYVTVFTTRLDKNASQLITFTRWHEDDLIGRLKDLCKKEQIPFHQITSYAQLEDCDPKAWYHINFSAIKEDEPTDIDPREKGEALWADKFDLDRLLEQRRLDPAKFESLYQGNPMPVEGLLYTRPFMTYKELPEHTKGMCLYCDVADKGEDYLCSIPYTVSLQNKIYCKDILYTQDGTEVTEVQVAEQIIRNKVKTAYIEANAGGSIFTRNIRKILDSKGYSCFIEEVKQEGNKESRILTHAVDVMENILFEEDWAFKYPEFYRDVKGFRKLFKANRHDDGADTITGIYEYAVGGKDALYMYD